MAMKNGDFIPINRVNPGGEAAICGVIRTCYQDHSLNSGIAGEKSWRHVLSAPLEVVREQANVFVGTASFINIVTSGKIMAACLVQ